jgi:hypothetical protein
MIKNLNKSNILFIKNIIMIQWLFVILYTISNFATQNISFIKNKNNNALNINDPFWHLKFFDIKDSFDQNNKKPHIVIIDGKINDEHSACDKLVELLKNLQREDSSRDLDIICQKNKNLYLYLMHKKLDMKSFIEKNHAIFTRNLILQIAPKASVSVISIFNQKASSEKSVFYQGLQEALKMNPDILHLGLQVTDFNSELSLDKKILKILKKFKCVVAPAGNYGYQGKSVGFPANCPFVISVGSFKKEGDHFLISDFCQTQGGVDFIMPGENLLTQIWIEELSDYFFIPVYGTSMAAALMTGQIAYLLKKVGSKNKLKAYQIKKILKNFSIYLDDSWPNYIRYGIPAL